MMYPKPILILFLIALSSNSYSQSDTTKKFEYELCVYRSAKEKPAVLKNEKTGIADTTAAYVYGLIVDHEGQGLGFASVNLNNLLDSSRYGSFTDTLGRFRVYVPPGRYRITAFFIGYVSPGIKVLSLAGGERHELTFRLGNGGTFSTFLVKSDKPLSQRKLRRLERRFRHYKTVL